MTNYNDSESLDSDKYESDDIQTKLDLYPHGSFQLDDNIMVDMIRKFTQDGIQIIKNSKAE